MNRLENIEIEEISILSKDVRPAVRHARIAVVKAADEDDRPQTFEEAVQDLRKCDRTLKSCVALRLARSRYPDLYEKSQCEAVAKHEAALQKMCERPVQKASAVRFTLLVDEHIRKNGGSRVEAMRAVRLANPREFASFVEV